MAKKKGGATGDWYTFKPRAAGSQKSEILIYGDIGESLWTDESVTAKAFRHELGEIPGLDNLSVRINSHGGSVSDGVAIYNALRDHPGNVTVTIDAAAHSIASLIAMSGDTVQMHDTALMMIHPPWGLVSGNAEEIRKAADVLDKHAEAMAGAYSRKSGKSIEDVLSLLTGEDDYWFTAAEARAEGFVDEVIEGAEPMQIAASARFPIPAAVVAKLSGAEEGQTMTDEKMATDTGAKKQGGDVVSAEIEQAKAEAVSFAKAQEHKRRGEIRAAFQGFVGRPEIRDLMDICLDDDAVSIDAARVKLLAKLGEGVEPLGGDPRIEMVADVRDKYKEGARDALTLRAGLKQDKPVDRKGNEFTSMTLLEMARVDLRNQGVDVGGMSRAQVVGEVFAAHSTSDFPYLLANTANKALQAAYSEFAASWRSWCQIGSVPDFKTNDRIRLGSFNSLSTIAEGGEYSYGTIGEEREQLTAATKGKAIRFTRQALINDDLGGFTRRATMLGNAAARTVTSDVYSVINTNAAMSDGTALFHADHSNLAGTGAAPTVATVGAGRSAMRLQTDTNSNYIDLAPSYLLAPVALEDTVRTLMAAEFDPTIATRTGRPNAVRGMAEVVVDPRLDATSTTAWYLVTAPGEAPLIEVAFLDGQQSPYTDAQESWSSDAMEWKVRLDYGVKSIDWRGGYKNAGA